MLKSPLSCLLLVLEHRHVETHTHTHTQLHTRVGACLAVNYKALEKKIKERAFQKSRVCLAFFVVVLKKNFNS